jgi:uncharacterized membrane protein
VISARWIRPLIIFASIAALGGAMTAGGASSVRTALAVLVLGVCPGLAVVGAIGLRDRWIEVSLVVALSLALDVIVSGALTYAVGWSPNAALVILLIFSLIGAAIQAARPPRPVSGP